MSSSHHPFRRREAATPLLLAVCAGLGLFALGANARAEPVPAPQSPAFALSGSVRLSDLASDDTIDRVLGMPTLAEGGVQVTTSRRLQGDLGARGSAVLDDDPGTWWSPGYLGQTGEFIRIQRTQPVRP